MMADVVFLITVQKELGSTYRDSVKYAHTSDRHDTNPEV